jgi:hypothetical protein
MQVIEVIPDPTGAVERRCKCRTCLKYARTLEIVIDSKAQGQVRSAAREFAKAADRLLPHLRQASAELSTLGTLAHALLQPRARASSQQGE